MFHLPQSDRNLASLHEMFTGLSREPLIVQKYLSAVSKGDKRVILVDGAPIGAINRVPAEGETRSNMHVGGRAEKVEMTDRDLEICARIGPLLREKGQIFVGIDVIGDHLTEINVTSPTGLQELERFDGTNAAGLIWDAIEARRHEPAPQRPEPRAAADGKTLSRAGPRSGGSARGFERKARFWFRAPQGSRFETDMCGGVRSLWALGPGVALQDGPAILYFHGGGYVFGSPERIARCWRSCRR